VTRVELLLLVAGMALVTLAARGSFLLLQDRIALPSVVRRSLTYVPAAVLAAIVTPALFTQSGVTIGPVDARLLAAAVAAVVAHRTRNVTATFAVGMVVLWTLTLALG
jgi:branched-subunit amino acid transport protein